MSVNLVAAAGEFIAAHINCTSADLENYLVRAVLKSNKDRENGLAFLTAEQFGAIETLIDNLVPQHQ